MAKIPKKPEDVFPELTDDFKKVFGRDLVSLILYGSGASGDYVPGKSDLNLLVVLSDKGIDELSKAIKTIPGWRKRKVATPLFMTRNFIITSLDSYPVEFINMKENHLVISGEDVFAELSFKPEHIRLQLERELKGKILHLRKGFMETDGKTKYLRELIKASLNAIIALFIAMLYLRHIDIPKGRQNVIRSVALAYSFDPETFLKCAVIRDDADHISSTEVHAVFQSYLKEIENLSKIIDHM